MEAIIGSERLQKFVDTRDLTKSKISYSVIGNRYIKANRLVSPLRLRVFPFEEQKRLMYENI
jgi:hypothetical protein